jgi:hypothetical protein
MKTALAMTTNGKFVALYGQEFSIIKRGNHTNVFEISKVISADSGEFDQLATFLDTNMDSANKPAIIMFNHPKNTSTVIADEYGLDDFEGNQINWLRRLGPHAALMQMINGPGQKAGTGLLSARPAESAFRKFLRLGFKLAPTADQDNHHKNWGNATDARTAIIAPSLTRAALLEAMRQRHVYATEDSNLKIIIKVNGHLCGDIVAPVSGGGEAEIKYFITDANEPNARYEIEVWRGTAGGPIAKMVSSTDHASGSGKIEDVALSGDPEFFFFKIIQSDSGSGEDEKEDESWTAPIWFENPAQSDFTESVVSAGDTSRFVASRNSRIYHVSSDCLDAKRIRSGNRVTGAEARKNRVLHDDCPRRAQR